jgi:hypothetical protein
MQRFGCRDPQFARLARAVRTAVVFTREKSVAFIAFTTAAEKPTIGSATASPVRPILPSCGRLFGLYRHPRSLQAIHKRLKLRNLRPLVHDNGM